MTVLPYSALSRSPRPLAFALGFLLTLPAIQADAAKVPPKAPEPGLAAVANDPSRIPVLTAGTNRMGSVLRVQILLDRMHYSTGEIDGHFGSLTRSAVAAFNAANGIKAGESVTVETWAKLNRDSAPVIVNYNVSPQDVAGPFIPIPSESAAKAQMTALGYTSVAEALGERFHISPRLLKALNPTVALDRAGSLLMVPNVTRTPLPEKTPGVSVRVDKSSRTVEAFDASGKLLARYPATMGSEHDPLPLGKWKINGVAWNPTFNYNPDLFWDAEPSEKKAKMPPGANNPVGVVWIDLSKPHYGIHGTPEPSTIGKTTSHGCIRLTNWDAVELAHLVSPGSPATLEP